MCSAVVNVLFTCKIHYYIFICYSIIIIMLIIFSSSFVLLHHHNYIKTIGVWHLFTGGLKFHDRTTIPRNFFVEFRLGVNDSRSLAPRRE